MLTARLHAVATARPGRTLRSLVRAVATSVYCRQRQFITVQPIGAAGPAAAAGEAGMDRKIQCVTVASSETFGALASHIPAEFRDSADDLARRVAQGCVVSLAFRRTDEGGLEIVGYEIAERGVFSAMGRRHAVSPEIVFSHWAEVLPAYRGQRIHARLFDARDAYFRRHGGRFVCGVVAPKNRASLQALTRAGSFVVGSVTRVSLLGGLLAWETSPERVEKTLRVMGV